MWRGVCVLGQVHHGVLARHRTGYGSAHVACDTRVATAQTCLRHTEWVAFQYNRPWKSSRIERNGLVFSFFVFFFSLDRKWLIFKDSWLLVTLYRDYYSDFFFLFETKFWRFSIDQVDRARNLNDVYIYDSSIGSRIFWNWMRYDII